MTFARRLPLLAVVLGVCAGRGDAITTLLTTTGTANPIRRVVSMLEKMQHKIKAEGKAEEKIFDEFMCYCKNGDAELQAAIASAKRKLPLLQSDLKSESAMKSQLQNEIPDAQQDRDEALRSLKKARKIRAQEERAFDADVAELKSNIEAFDHAIVALEKHSGGNFLQTEQGARFGQLVRSTEMSDARREVLLAFLSGKENGSGLGMVIGVLKELKSELEKSLESQILQNRVAEKDFSDMKASKTKQSLSLTAATQFKKSRLSEVSTDFVNTDEDLEDTETGLDEDTHFKRDLGMECATKQSEWDKRSKMRSDELLALADTINLLNGDEALELFKKTLPSASLLQVQISSKEVMRKARHVLGIDQNHDPRLDFISLAMRGKTANFEKVLKMIDDMVDLLKEEQISDDRKKEYCLKELDTSDDESKVLARASEKGEAHREEVSETLDGLKRELGDLNHKIKELDARVAEAADLQKQESAQTAEGLAQNTAALNLLSMAKKRMNKLYNPTQASAASFVQLSSRRVLEDETDGDAPAPPPKAFNTYSRQSGASSGVLGLIDTLMQDIKKEMAEAELESNASQKDYKTFIDDSSKKRQTLASELRSKDNAKVEAIDNELKYKKDVKNTGKQIMALAEYIKDLHLECDWLVKNHDVRAKARSGEIDALNKATVILSGGDSALLQIGSTHRHRAFLA